MRVLVIGGSGTIGAAVASELAGRHDVIRASRTTGDTRVDITSKASIEALFRHAGPVDAVVCTAGAVRFGPLEKLTDEDFESGFRSRLMGQANVVRVGFEHVSEGGSITLTSGLLARQPMPGGSMASMMTGGIDGWVRGAALEAPRGIRINAVAPPWVRETLERMGRDGSAGLPAAVVAKAYVAAVEGTHKGEILEPAAFL